MTTILSNYAPITMTDFIKKGEIKNNWVLIDAENAVVGRLAAYISTVLRGKNKSQYTPHMDNGDFVVVTNIEKIKFTSPSRLSKNKPEEILKLAVRRMLPDGPLAKKQLTKLKIYKGDSHPHDIQKPKIINFNKINKKNYLSVN